MLGSLASTTDSFLLLVCVQERGVEFLGDDAPPDSNSFFIGRDLQQMISAVLALSVPRLDDFYFSLVALARDGVRVPVLAFNAVIGASGRLGLLDRGFATFQEKQAIFGLGPPKRSTYNALLAAVASSYQPNVMSMLSIMGDMDANGVAPDNSSFALLLDALSERLHGASGEVPRDTLVDELLNILQERNGAAEKIPSPPVGELGRALRRLAVSYAKDYAESGKESFKERLDSLMSIYTGTKADEWMLGMEALPRHFQTRMRKLLATRDSPSHGAP